MSDLYEFDMPTDQAEAVVDTAYAQHVPQNGHGPTYDAAELQEAIHGELKPVGDYVVEDMHVVVRPNRFNGHEELNVWGMGSHQFSKTRARISFAVTDQRVIREGTEAPIYDYRMWQQAVRVYHKEKGKAPANRAELIEFLEAGPYLVRAVRANNGIHLKILGINHLPYHNPPGDVVENDIPF